MIEDVCASRLLSTAQKVEDVRQRVYVISCLLSIGQKVQFGRGEILLRDLEFCS